MQHPSDRVKKSQAPFKGFLPFFWLALAALGGIQAAAWVGVPAWPWLIGLGASLVLWALSLALPRRWALTHWLIRWTRADRRLPGTVLVAVFFLAGWRFIAVQPELTPAWIGYYNGRGELTMVGEVVAPPDPCDTHTNLTLQVHQIELAGEDASPLQAEISGLVLVQARSGRDWAYGDLISAEGVLETPFETAEFSYRDYLAHQGIYSIMPFASLKHLGESGGSPIQSWLYSLRYKSQALLRDIFPSPEADLMAGILLGLDQGLSSDLQDAFKKTGITHIIAISGFNMAILAGLFMGIFTRLLGRRWGPVCAILGITIYTVFVGAEPAVVRAAFMGGLGVLGGMFGRRQNGLNSLGLAVFVMVLADPNLPWDIGFQLSAAATLGLVLYAQPLEVRATNWLGRWLSEEQAHRIVGPFSEFFLFTLAAQVMTLPIIAYHFGGFSWITFLANPLILPPQPLVLILGGLALFLGLILPGLGQVAAILALPFIRYTIRMVSWLGRLPDGGMVLPDFHPLWLLLFYALLFGLTLVPKEAKQEWIKKSQPALLGILVLSGLTVFVWARVLARPDGRLHLTLLDDEGTILVQSPGGEVGLLGGGASPSQLREALGERLPPGRLQVDWVLAASPAQVDLNGLLGGIRPNLVGAVLWGVDPGASQTSRRVYSQFTEGATLIEQMAPGQALDFGQGLILTVLAQSEKGAVLWLEWGRFSAVLPAGKVADAWLAVPEAPDVVLLPDDISVENFPLEVITAWSPTVILLPLHNSDLPIAREHELVSLLSGYPLMTSLDHGWVQVSTDGKQMWVDAER